MHSVVDSLWVAKSGDLDFLTRFECIGRNLDHELVFIIVIEEVEGEGLLGIGRIVLTAPGLEVFIESAFRCDTLSLDLLVFIEPYVHGSFESKLWDLNVQLLHESGHKLLDSTVNVHGGLTMKWCFLKINNDKLSTISNLISKDVCWDSNSQARSKAEHNIGANTSVFGFLE